MWSHFSREREEEGEGERGRIWTCYNSCDFSNPKNGVCFTFQLEQRLAKCPTDSMRHPTLSISCLRIHIPAHFVIIAGIYVGCLDVQIFLSCVSCLVKSPQVTLYVWDPVRCSGGVAACGSHARQGNGLPTDCPEGCLHDRHGYSTGGSNNTGLCRSNLEGLLSPLWSCFLEWSVRGT